MQGICLAQHVIHGVELPLGRKRRHPNPACVSTLASALNATTTTTSWLNAAVALQTSSVLQLFLLASLLRRIFITNSTCTGVAPQPLPPLSSGTPTSLLLTASLPACRICNALVLMQLHSSASTPASATSVAFLTTSGSVVSNVAILALTTVQLGGWPAPPLQLLLQRMVGSAAAPARQRNAHRLFLHRAQATHPPLARRCLVQPLKLLQQRVQAAAGPQLWHQGRLMGLQAAAVHGRCGCRGSSGLCSWSSSSPVVQCASACPGISA